MEELLQFYRKGFLPLPPEYLSEVFEEDINIIQKDYIFFLKLFYLYKISGMSTYLAYALGRENEEVRNKISREFDKLKFSDYEIVFEFDSESEKITFRELLMKQLALIKGFKFEIKDEWEKGFTLSVSS